MSEVRTQDMSKFPIRLLKKMRKYHRKLRAHTQHRDSFKSLSATVKHKQDLYFIQQRTDFTNRLFQFLQRKRRG